MQLYLVDSKLNKVGRVTTEHKHVTVDTLDGRYDFNDRCRTCKVLVDIVETLGKRASGPYSDLKIVEIPDSATDFYIDEYDGIEEVIYVMDGKIKFKGVYDDG